MKKLPACDLTFENHYILGRLYDRQGEYSKGLYHLQFYYESQRNKEDAFGQFKALTFISENYCSLEEWERAFELQLECLRLSEEIEDKSHRYDALNNLCDICISKKEMELAEEYALALEEEYGKRNSALLKTTVLTTLLELRTMQERWSEASTLAKQLKELHEQRSVSPSFRVFFEGMKSLGVLAFKQGNFQEALLFLEDSHARALETNEQTLQLATSLYLTKTYQALGQTEKALELLKVRLRLLEQQQSHRMTQVRQKAETQYQTRVLESERKHQLEEQRLRLESLRELQAVRDDVLEHLLNELDSPLHSIQYQIEVLEEEGGFVEEHGRFYGDEMVKQVQRLLQLNQNLLNLTQLEGHTLQKEEVYISTLLTSLAHEQLPHAQSRSQSLEVHNQLLTNVQVFVDRALLTAALENLLSNAIKYTQPGGRIILRVRQQEEFLCLEVEDNGPGIDEKNQSRIFERFFRCGQHSKGVEGTGLGLSIVQSTMERHNGRVEVESQLGEGSCFRLLLPWERGMDD